VGRKIWGFIEKISQFLASNKSMVPSFFPWQNVGASNISGFYVKPKVFRLIYDSIEVLFNLKKT
jgi:hypothetical protein